MTDFSSNLIGLLPKSSGQFHFRSKDRIAQRVSCNERPALPIISSFEPRSNTLTLLPTSLQWLLSWKRSIPKLVCWQAFSWCNWSALYGSANKIDIGCFNVLYRKDTVLLKEGKSLLLREESEMASLRMDFCRRTTLAPVFWRIWMKVLPGSRCLLVPTVWFLVAIWWADGFDAFWNFWWAVFYWSISVFWLDEISILIVWIFISCVTISDLFGDDESLTSIAKWSDLCITFTHRKSFVNYTARKAKSKTLVETGEDTAASHPINLERKWELSDHAPTILRRKRSHSYRLTNQGTGSQKAHRNCDQPKIISQIFVSSFFLKR
jgi:hypothetical protein